MQNRNLSVKLNELLAEAKALTDLKSEFGRIPDSHVKMVALEAITEWFKYGKVGHNAEKSQKGPEQNGKLEVGGNTLRGQLHSVQTDGNDEADNVPDDDEIPF